MGMRASRKILTRLGKMDETGHHKDSLILGRSSRSGCRKRGPFSERPGRDLVQDLKNSQTPKGRGPRLVASIAWLGSRCAVKYETSEKGTHCPRDV